MWLNTAEIINYLLVNFFFGICCHWKKLNCFLAYHKNEKIIGNEATIQIYILVSWSSEWLEFVVGFGFPWELNSFGNRRLNRFWIGVDDRTVQGLNSLNGGLTIETDLWVHHVLHDTVTAGLMFARCKYGSDRLGATDRTERILGWQRYVGEQWLLNAQTLN